jgi:hypothetical protein
MRCPLTGAPPLCNTSDLNEELGEQKEGLSLYFQQLTKISSYK